MDSTTGLSLEALNLLVSLAALPTSLNDLLITVSNILIVAVGLGLVIFFHELGHFAVAKWCNVYVERFSIGFGPILLSRKYGESEYALSAIPFGGYVKMLGQDDADPNQMADTQLARDPRSYTAKNVWQRMAIISAGVIMNLITGMFFFVGAYRIGLEETACVVGDLVVGQPAWQAGVERGDRITKINDENVNEFMDIMRNTLLSTKDTLVLEGQHRDKSEFKYVIKPKVKEGETRPMIGVAPARSVKYNLPKELLDSELLVLPAHKADPPLRDGDRIVSSGDQKFATFHDLQDYLAIHRSDEVELKVERLENDKVTTFLTKVKPNPFRTLGIRMDIGQIVGIKDNSPALAAGFNIGDKILSVDGLVVGVDLDPVHLPEYFADKQGQEVAVVVKREAQAAAEEIPLKVTPKNFPGWIEHPLADGLPLSIPSIGIAYHQLNVVLKVDPQGPAAGIVKEYETIRGIRFILPPNLKKDMYGSEPVNLEKAKDGQSWDFLCSFIQENRLRIVELEVVDKENKSRRVEITPQDEKAHFAAERGFYYHMSPESVTLKAENFGAAYTLAITKTRKSAIDNYLMIRNMITGKLSPMELRGPLSIAKVAYLIANEGFGYFLKFLAFLSINLAVVNFLPIPVLEGGHMVFLLWEAVTGKKPSDNVVIGAMYVGFIFILSLMFLVMFLDIFVHKIFTS